MLSGGLLKHENDRSKLAFRAAAGKVDRTSRRGRGSDNSSSDCEVMHQSQSSPHREHLRPPEKCLSVSNPRHSNNVSGDWEGTAFDSICQEMSPVY